MIVSQDDIYDIGLYLIDNILKDSGHSLSNFSLMPRPHLNWSGSVNNHLISEQIDYDSENESFTAHQLISSLNDDKKVAFKQIYNSIIHKQGKLFFIDSYGGSA